MARIRYRTTAAARREAARLDAQAERIPDLTQITNRVRMPDPAVWGEHGGEL